MSVLTTKTDEHICKTFRTSLAYLKGVAYKRFKERLRDMPKAIQEQLPAYGSEPLTWYLQEEQGSSFITAKLRLRIPLTVVFDDCSNVPSTLFPLDMLLRYCFADPTDQDNIGKVEIHTTALTDNATIYK